MKAGKLVLAALVLLHATPVWGQEVAVGAGKLEVGGFPAGGMFFIGGDDNTEVDFGIYTLGGNLTWYLTPRVAVEGELSGGPGIAQNVTYRNSFVKHRYVPNLWNYSANLVVFPGGATGRRFPWYVTGGAGMVALASRDATRLYGYDPDRIGSENFAAGNVGAGLKIFRAADVPQWGFRVDYRLFMVSADSGAPAFFAHEKNRIGHRVYAGLLYTLRR